MIELLKSHRSVRKYKDEEIPKEKFYELIDAAQHAASSSFMQAYSVIHVTDPIKREKLGQLSNNELQYNSAALALVFCADLKRLDTATKLREKEFGFDTLENLFVATIDTSIFAQNFVVAAESEGYGICYIGGVRNNPMEISELLSLPKHVIPLFGMTVGIPDENNELKPRIQVESIVHQNEYDEEKYEEQIINYDNIMNNYYLQRSSNVKDTNWSESIVDLLSKKGRLHLKDFVQSKGFLSK